MNLSDLANVDNAVLRELIEARIRVDGSISFAEFMEVALYHPEQGYYFTAEPAADYQTSPNVHPVFGAALARQIADFWRLLGRPARFEIFEAGAGDGRLAADILSALRSEEAALYDACHYTLQDVTLRGPDATRRLQRAGLPTAKVAIREDLPPAGSIEGCILSNELLDALPFYRVRRRGESLYEIRVSLAAGRLVDEEVSASSGLCAYFEALGLQPGEGCAAEVNLAAREWIERAGRALRRGFLLTLDYGYEAADLYSDWRRAGTLLSFHRHTAGSDPYVRVGRQDITASIDFTTIGRAAEAAGLHTYGSTTQAELLAALGVGEALRAPPAADQLEPYYTLRRSVIELTDPSGLGRIRALVQGKGTPDTLPEGLRPAR